MYRRMGKASPDARSCYRIERGSLNMENLFPPEESFYLIVRTDVFEAYYDKQQYLWLMLYLDIKHRSYG